MDHGHENEVQKLREAQIFCTERGSSVQENSMSVPKRTMSVPEMRRLLGVKKTESYWLVHRNFSKQSWLADGCGLTWKALRNGTQIR